MTPRKWATICMSTLGVLGFLLVINEPLKSLLITRMGRIDIAQTIHFRGNHSKKMVRILIFRVLNRLIGRIHLKLGSQIRLELGKLPFRRCD